MANLALNPTAAPVHASAAIFWAIFYDALRRTTARAQLEAAASVRHSAAAAAPLSTAPPPLPLYRAGDSA